MGKHLQRIARLQDTWADMAARIVGAAFAEIQQTASAAAKTRNPDKRRRQFRAIKRRAGFAMTFASGGELARLGSIFQRAQWAENGATDPRAVAEGIAELCSGEKS